MSSNVVHTSVENSSVDTSFGIPESGTGSVFVSTVFGVPVMDGVEAGLGVPAMDGVEVAVGFWDTAGFEALYEP